MKKIKILWAAYNCPVKCDPQAGSQTFYYYFRAFLNDDRFDIKLIACGKESIKEKTEQELADVKHAVRYITGSKRDRLKAPINWESTFNILFNKHANMIQNTEKRFIIGRAMHLKRRGYKPDVVILEWTNVVVLAEEFKRLFPESKIAANEAELAYIALKRNMEYSFGVNRLRWGIRHNRCKRAELAALKKCDLIILQNYDDRLELKEEGISGNKILRFTPFYHDLTGCHRKSNGRDILFFGDMSCGENEKSVIWFIDNVMPLLTDLDIRFIVMGGNPTENMKAKSGRRIIVTGFVDSIIEYFEQSMCFVAPMVLGAGIKVKVMEALSSGIPVLTNHIGIGGIPARDGLEYFKCETPGDYARVIKGFMSGENDEERMSQAGKRMMLENFSLEKSIEGYKEKLVSMTKSNNTLMERRQ